MDIIRVNISYCLTTNWKKKKDSHASERLICHFGLEELTSKLKTIVCENNSDKDTLSKLQKMMEGDIPRKMIEFHDDKLCNSRKS